MPLLFAADVPLVFAAEAPLVFANGLTLLDFFENDLAQGLLPPAVDAANLDVHRQLLDAIAAGEGPAVDAAIARHDHLRTSLGMFRAGSDAEVPAISK